MDNNLDYENFETKKPHVLVISKETYDEYQNSPVLDYYHSILEMRGNITKKFAMAFLDDERFYNYFKRIVDMDYSHLSIDYYFSKDTYTGLRINKVDLLKLLLAMDDLDKKQQEKLSNLVDTSNRSALYRKYKNEKYTTLVDNNYVSLNFTDMFDVLFSSEERFKQYVESKSIFGVDSSEFFYVLNDCIRDRNILEKYLVPDFVIKRYKLLKQQLIVDFEAINYFRYMEGLNLDFEINKELENLVLKDIDTNFNNLEKTIYIYIKLCKIFSYDPKFYTNSQRGPAAKFHQDINRVPLIKDSDDEIVCYEFSALFSKFLDKLNIDYRIISGHNVYGVGHAYVKYRVDKFIVNADSVTSIISGDLINAKLDIELDGLKCVNESKKTKRDFNLVLNRVYKQIANKEITKEATFKTNDLLILYSKLSENANIKRLRFRTRVEVLLEQVNSARLKEVDELGYIIKLKNVFFNEEELENNINFCVLKSSIDENCNSCVVISINEDGQLQELPSNNKYLIHIPNKGTTSVGKNEIQRLLKKGKIEYIKSSVGEIPGFINKNRRNRR